MCFQRLTFGLARAISPTEGGRRAEDPFRGLRAGPARSSPRLLPPPTPKTTPNGPYPSAEVRLQIHERSWVNQMRAELHQAQIFPNHIMNLRFNLRELAGAVGFEPTPSALTVRCPTGWTTPQ